MFLHQKQRESLAGGELAIMRQLRDQQLPQLPLQKSSCGCCAYPWAPTVATTQVSTSEGKDMRRLPQTTRKDTGYGAEGTN